MKKILLLLLPVFVFSAGFAQVKSTIKRSVVSFTIKNMGINCTGTFNGLQAGVQFKPDDLPGSSIEATIDATTVSTENEMRDNHLKNADYFDVTAYPRVTMRSVSFKHKNAGNYTGIFNVTIKNKTKLVEVPFTYTESGSNAVFNGSFKINRKDFGLGGNSMVLADEATVTVNAEISK